MGTSDGPMKDMTVHPQVTRVEVIDNTGRAFTAYYATPGVMIDIQDDGRTVKVFAGVRAGENKWR